jgi:hypothetical protein
MGSEFKTPTRRNVLDMLAKGYIGVVGAGTVAGTGAFVAGEVQREVKDRKDAEWYAEQTKIKIDQIQVDFGVTIDVKTRGARSDYGVHDDVYSPSVLYEAVQLIEKELWKFPPDTLYRFVRYIGVAGDLGTFRLGGYTWAGGDTGSESRKRVESQTRARKIVACSCMK